MPLPSALRGLSGLFMVQNLFRQLDVAFRASGTGIVTQDRFAKAGGLRQTDAPWDHGLEELVLEEFLQIRCYLPGEVGSIVEHRQQDTLYDEGVMEGFTDPVNSVHE